MKKNRILSLLIVAVLIAAMTGCQQGTVPPSATAGVAPSADASAPAEQEKPTQITYYRNNVSFKCLPEWAEAAWVKQIEKNMNVEMDFQGPNTGDDYMQAAALMLASGTLTDLFYYDWNRYDGGLAAAIDDGLIVNVSAKYKDKMPTWFSIIDSHDDVRKAVTLDDGTSAMFCHLELDLRRAAYWGLGIRADWLKKLDLQMPTTMDELYNVLVAFRDEDPNGNGQTDEIPFTDENWFPSTVCLIAPFGLLYNEPQLDPGTGKITYWTLVNDGKNFTDCVTTLNKWYKEGLIDPEFSTQDGTAEDAKWAGDRIGCGQMWPVQIEVYTDAIKMIDPNADVQGMPAMIGEAGKPYTSNPAHVRPAGTGEGTCILTQAEKDGSIDACLRLIDYMYTEEGSEIINWGIEGVSYTRNADGTHTWADAVLNDPQYNKFDKVLTYAIPQQGGWPKVMSYESWASMEASTPAQRAATEQWWNADTGIVTPPLVLSSSESKEYARIMNDVNTAISESFVKFIIGTLPLSEIPDLIKQCKDLGIEEAMAMYQSAYDRYTTK